MSPITSTECVHLPAGAYAVFAHDLDAGVNGGLPFVTALFGFSLTNSGGSLAITAPDGGAVDSITYPAATPGVSLQLDPGKLDALANDNPAAFCASTKTYGFGDLGTPGIDNTPCGAPPDTADRLYVNSSYSPVACSPKASTPT